MSYSRFLELTHFVQLDFISTESLLISSYSHPMIITVLLFTSITLTILDASYKWKLETFSSCPVTDNLLSIISSRSTNR